MPCVLVLLMDEYGLCLQDMSYPVLTQGVSGQLRTWLYLVAVGSKLEIKAPLGKTRLESVHRPGLFTYSRSFMDS